MGSNPAAPTIYRRGIRSQPMIDAIIPIAIFLIVIFALNKIVTGRFG